MGREYHKRELKLFMKHFINARTQLKSGTAKARFPAPRSEESQHANNIGSRVAPLIFFAHKRSMDSPMSSAVI
jgi:hypothetical protein